MKTWHLTQQIGPEGLHLAETSTPSPGPNEVLIRIRAHALNFRDLMIVSGQYGPPPTLPLVPLSDGAGEIMAVGDRVTQWKCGDRVAGTFFQGWQSGPCHSEVFGWAMGGALPGMLAEYVTLSENGVVGIPAHMSYEEGATLPCAAVTAWQALVTHGHVSADKTVLILGTGGVSIFGLQIAKLHGARVIATSSSDEKLARAKVLGADTTINYRTTPAWDEEVRRLTGGRGVDHVVEVGGLDTFEKSLRSLAMNGVVSVIGGVSGFTSGVQLRDILAKNALIRGIFVGNRDMFQAMNSAFDRHELRPAIDRIFPFEEAPDAFRYLQSGAHFGKVVISGVA